VQALLYTTKSTRVDGDQPRMLFCDPGDRALAEAMVHDYVRKQFADTYNSDVRGKIRLEREALKDELVKTFVTASTVADAAAVLRTGLQRGPVHMVMDNTTSHGYVELRAQLLDVTVPVPDRLAKMRMLLLGRDTDGQPVWNRGNVLFADLAPFEAVFQKLDAEAEWATIVSDYRSRYVHTYRASDKANRHSHWNGKPSYWALGYPTLDIMIRTVSEADWQEYKRIHCDCCGISQLR